jgi:hypothetical protein
MHGDGFLRPMSESIFQHHMKKTGSSTVEGYEAAFFALWYSGLEQASLTNLAN